MIAIHDGPLGMDVVTAAGLLSPGHGAVCSFLGVVRDHHDGRQVTGLHYACYRPMAERILAALADEVRSRFAADAAIVAVHGIGDMTPGQVSVALHVASAHRDAAFAGCRHLIERIKADLPVWKRESYADGSAVWLKGA
jgi:molybdopterin synthase catalytic subunit